MLKPQDLYLCLHEENTDFRSKLIQAGFSENIFKCKEADKVEFYIIKQEDSISEKRDYGNADIIIFIGTDTVAVRHIIDNTCKSVLAFENENACLYFLYSIVAEYVFGMFKEFDWFEFYDAFMSTYDNVKIIACENVDILNKLLTKTVIFSINTTTHDTKYDKLYAWEKQIADIFPTSCVSFIMPQDIISFNKVFYASICSKRG